ncbi:translation elongation factor Ts [Pseudoclavibacter sp. 13-3]|uniref:translation elongation factor Ts n=1 Tax=Pseudoclavibacter sp. 13-3 TaxID=2901228 RepID=UPI001E3FECC1|nr:translation elongation factor Ts [Pseudoclavibacter sp. 13-3]MCD7100879.1 translation elongation factor Ts [Pseudoclavibacter sp. 13-3]
MANYTAADVKALRERTGSGMLDCKKALDEAEGDVEKAIELLRVKGLKGVAKREGRTTTNGLIAAKVDGRRAYLIELACETDFVAKNERFIELAEQVLTAIAEVGAADLTAALAAPVEGKNVEELITDTSAIIGEKVELRRLTQLEGEHFAVYLHRTNPDLPPQLGVIVSYDGDDSETAHSIAQHISFADPKYMTREEVPAEDVENERRIAEETSRNEGKPEKALPRIVEGRLNGFFKTIVLPDQDYARDHKLSIAQVLKDAGLTVNSFVRFRVGA